MRSTVTSTPFLIQPILYGFGCFSVGRFKAFTNALEIKLSLLPLSIIKSHSVINSAPSPKDGMSLIVALLFQSEKEPLNHT